VSIEISEGAGVRSLHFGTPWIQGSMRIARPWALELEYTRDMMFPLLLHAAEDWPQRALMIGLGAGSMLKFLYRHRPRCSFTVIEIDPQVILAAHQHFRVPLPDARLALHIADGFDWLREDRNEYPLILVDGFDRNARAHRLESETFYAACRARLAPGGWLSCNLLTLHRSHAATRRALQTVFGQGVQLLPACAEGNVVALASTDPASAADYPALRSAAAALRQATQLNLLPLISRIERG
jgi:spermidine synthase